MKQPEWKIATQLAPNDDDTWTAPGVDRMMDGTVELSAHAMVEWKIGNSQFRMALHHRGNDEEAAAYAKLCQAVVTEPFCNSPSTAIRRCHRAPAAGAVGAEDAAGNSG